MKTAIPPNGVTAGCVSRRINRSSDNRAMISRGTGLSVAFDSIPLLSQILGGPSYAELRFSGLERANGRRLGDRKPDLLRVGHGKSARHRAVSKSEEKGNASHRLIGVTRHPGAGATYTLVGSLRTGR